MLPDDAQNHQLPSSLVAEVFGEVNAKRTGGTVEVNATVLTVPSIEDEEGYQTGVALDGSASMRNSYGVSMRGNIPSDVIKEYVKKGWIKKKLVDGKERTVLASEAESDAVERGILSRCENAIEPIARQFVESLASGLDDDGGTTLIYWACGKAGDKIEVVGDIAAEECESLKVGGPSKGFGNGTMLVPAISYFEKRFADAPKGIYVFITDGELDDFDQVKAYTRDLAHRIHRGERHPIKFVLIGLGDDLNADQLEELDDLDTGVPVDIWDHKIASEMRQLEEIFAEIVDENEIVFPPSTIHDQFGNLVKDFPLGVPALIEFEISAESEFFEIRCQGEAIRQGLTMG